VKDSTATSINEIGYAAARNRLEQSVKDSTATFNNEIGYAAACHRLEVCVTGLLEPGHGHLQQLQLLQQCHQWVLATEHPPASE